MATLGRVHDGGTGPQEPNWPSWTALPGRCTGAGWWVTLSHGCWQEEPILRGALKADALDAVKTRPVSAGS
jgi:hypothetical protein